VIGLNREHDDDAKKMLLGLLIIPVAMIVFSLFQKTINPGFELSYLVFGVPICVLNMWE